MTWWADQADEWRRLRGGHVVAWRGVEMALRENVGGQPQFTDPTVPCLQLLQLDMQLSAGSLRRIGTSPDDDLWGLMVHGGGEGGFAFPFDGIYRERVLEELPTGVVDDVAVVLDEEERVIAEVVLRVGGSRLLLVAGELYEGLEGQLTFAHLDESVLAFVDPRQADAIAWMGGRSLQTTS
jgi:hypothetical protein